MLAVPLEVAVILLLGSKATMLTSHPFLALWVSNRKAKKRVMWEEFTFTYIDILLDFRRSIVHTKLFCYFKIEATN